MIEAAAAQSKPNWTKRILIGVGLALLAVVVLFVRQAGIMNEKIAELDRKDARMIMSIESVRAKLVAELSVGVAIPAKIESKDVRVASDGKTFCGAASVEKRGGSYVGHRKFYMRDLASGQREVAVAPLPNAGAEAMAEFTQSYERVCASAVPA